jgi:hypothetical protein
MMWSDMYFQAPGSGPYRDNPVPDDVKKDIPEPVQLVYWDYYHDKEDHYRAMIERHRALGADPVMASGVWTWGGHTWYARRNTEAFAGPCIRAARAAGLKELFFTMWGDDGAYCEYDSALAGLAWAAETAWTGAAEADRLEPLFQAVCGASYRAVLEAAESNQPVAPALVLWDDPLLGLNRKGLALRGADFWPGVRDHYRKVMASLAPQAGVSEPIDFAHLHTVVALLHAKVELALKLDAAYAGRDRAGLRHVAEAVPGVQQAIDRALASFRRQWTRRNKPHGFETIQIRLGGQKARYDELALRIRELLDGKAETIPELEESPPENCASSHWRRAAAATTIL